MLLHKKWIYLAVSLLLTIIFIFHFIRVINFINTYRWIKTSCAIQSSSVESKRVEKQNWSKVNIVYSYDVNKIEYTSNRYYYIDDWSDISPDSESDPHEIVKKYTPSAYIKMNDKVIELLKAENTAENTIAFIKRLDLHAIQNKEQLDEFLSKEHIIYQNSINDKPSILFFTQKQKDIILNNIDNCITNDICFVNPSNPSQAVLKKGFSFNGIWSIFWIILSIILLVFCVTAFIKVVNYKEEDMIVPDNEIVNDFKAAEKWIQEGNAFLKLGKYKDAIQCYDRALLINPEDIEALSCRQEALNSYR